MLEDTDSGQLEDIDVIPNEEMLLVHYWITVIMHYSCFFFFCCSLKLKH